MSTADTLSEADVQLLIALEEMRQSGKDATPAHLAEATAYFKQSLLDWSGSFASLAARGLISAEDQTYKLTSVGAPLAEQLRQGRPPMWYWYNDYYIATKDSKAYAVFCERVFGRNFVQHGFSDMAQLDRLLEIAALSPANRVLDLGCGNGAMGEYVATVTGAHVTGIDYIPEAIRQAQERARDNPLLSFHVMSIAGLTFPPHSFDTLISIDTMYFTDLDATLEQMMGILAPGGQMAIFYSHGLVPWLDKETFPRETLAPERTPLGEALTRRRLYFRTWDLTQADYVHAQLTKRVINELRADLEAEGNLFLYHSRNAEADGVMAAVEAGLQARLLYHVTT
jgi:SAM-dependent methyltransferase